ncbi:MAG: hypothetical protein DRP64_07400 [Verrucomicrobia bacterium]|nr:MAG: hypothetical protein DRP64_07400 [Verrucomicrobiota bacterium]
MIAFGILAIFVILIPILFLKKRGVDYPLYPIAIICLVVQALYLLQVLLYDHSPDTEYWMFLALSYLPISIVILMILGVLSVIKGFFWVFYGGTTSRG